MTEKNKIDPDLMTDLKIFHKLSGLYKWTWKEYKETPIWVITGLCYILDEFDTKDLTKFVAYDEYMEYRNLIRANPPREDND